MHDVVKDIEVVGLRRFDDAVKDSTGIGTIFRLAEQPGFSANHEGLYGSFRTIVVDAQLSIQCVAFQFRPLVWAVLNGFTQFCFWQDLLLGFDEPSLKLFQ